MFLQTLITGLSIGGIYALMAVGYSLVFSILNFSNFAHGTIIMLGAYIGYFLISWFYSSLAISLLGAIVGAAIFALLNVSLAYIPLINRKAPPLYLMITSMGVSIFLENMVYVTVGSHFYSFPEIFKKSSVSFFGSEISTLDLFALIFSFIAISGLHLFLTRTKMGTAIRAASYDMTVASLNGVNMNRLIGVVFILAGAFAGIAGVFLGIKYMVYPTMGWITSKAYIAAVIGGLGSLPGAVIGGVILGILETFVSVYISSVIRDVFSFSLVIIFLVILPAGLLGKYLEEKV
ncbi:branched-chain amino acid ABC transporter permease [Thermosediminibacter litoriperuensis]|uniref:Amino acid/amide ABC transporter membrane protein 1, HAAT family (TC 3.A.1.4.-) n=1 Tax=Thermosediminibacter litoriperuensis TaxID=291989 RepID=A0A5S5AZU9_9FIRM|nr:branched-chain amino acid ABC transporter permease [Thermosediminibacter litoriperuensis]TYP58785.1 amino acid/amide ABC transporter membrane protein 1, HAAT family (TC 3.A.1.4.-) [Thermosediminibacter litoriperuensis]